MSRPYRKTGDAVRTRGEWRSLLDQAARCADDVAKSVSDEAAYQRRAALANRLRGASTTVIEREIGAAAGDVAVGFLRTASAFARTTTAEALRVELTALMMGSVLFLDKRLADKASEDFRRAHAGRPEVYG